MKKNTKRLFLLTIAALTISWAAYSYNKSEATTDYNNYASCEITFNNRATIKDILLADTRRKISTGLSAHPNPTGMIFSWPENQSYEFWMKDTAVPLSIAFIRNDGEITDIFDMEINSKIRYQSSQPTSMALEVPRGGFESIGVTESSAINNITCRGKEGATHLL